MFLIALKVSFIGITLVFCFLLLLLLILRLNAWLAGLLLPPEAASQAAVPAPHIAAIGIALYHHRRLENPAKRGP